MGDFHLKHRSLISMENYRKSQEFENMVFISTLENSKVRFWIIALLKKKMWWACLVNHSVNIYWSFVFNYSRGGSYLSIEKKTSDVCVVQTPILIWKRAGARIYILITHRLDRQKTIDGLCDAHACGAAN